jgi:protein-tyrosine phosphatase
LSEARRKCEEACQKLTARKLGENLPSAVKAFLAAGVTFFVDLTEERELKPYAEIAREEAEKVGMSTVHRRFPIRDAWVPTCECMRDILDAMTAAMDEGHVVYIHCYGGIGRTGTVAGCWLVEQGLTAGEALERIRHLRKGTTDGGIRSPENDTQKRFIEDWR